MTPEPGKAVDNLFVHRTSAERYAASRPYFHPQAVRRIAEVTQTRRFKRALDVACGTGQSSRALAEIAERVDAIDISSEMLAVAEARARVHYQVASAEALPFDEAALDLVTVGLAFHWFDQAEFLKEAARVLKPKAWLVTYNSAFSGEMMESPGLRDWVRDAYLNRFPIPPRHAPSLRAETVEPFGFSFEGEEKFSHQETMTAEQLTGYLLTQTNVIAAVESGGIPLPEVAEWILEGVGPQFEGRKGTLRFKAAMWFARKPAAT